MSGSQAQSPLEAPYLRRHRFFATRDLDESRDLMSKLWGGHRVVPADRTPFETVVNHAGLGRFGLTSVACSTPLRIEAVCNPEVYRIAFHDSGACRQELNGESRIATPAVAVIWPPGTDLRLQAGAVRLLALELPRTAVEAEMDAGRCSPGANANAPTTVTLGSGAGSCLRSLCCWTAHELDKPNSPLDSVLRARPQASQTSRHISEHLEQTLLCLFQQARRDGAGRVEDQRAQGAKIGLAQLEDWIRANLREPITLETLAAIAGVSRRALQANFRRQRGRTPMEQVRILRLEEVRRQIQLRGPDASVTEIALELGFFHLGHFARAYRQHFGERPSDTCRHWHGFSGSVRDPAPD
jgi:AraC-like DNA-binding protein